MIIKMQKIYLGTSNIQFLFIYYTYVGGNMLARCLFNEFYSVIKLLTAKS